MRFGGGKSGEEEGICLGADTRATEGPIVADKNCEKVSWLQNCIGLTEDTLSYSNDPMLWCWHCSRHRVSSMVPNVRTKLTWRIRHRPHLL